MAQSDTYIAKALQFSGDFWSSRIVREQEPLIRALASLGDESARFESLGRHTLGSAFSGNFDVWKLPADCAARYATKWLQPLRSELEGNVDTPLLFKAGDKGMVLAGELAAASAEGLRVNGFLLQDLQYTGPAIAAGLQVGGRYILLPRNSTRGSDDFSLTVETTEGSYTLLAYPEALLTAGGDGAYAGIEHSTWFIPCRGTPQVLLTRKGPLVRNLGFVQVENWLALFDDPSVLWPSGTVVALSNAPQEGTPRSSAMRADLFQGTGTHVMTYLRTNQSPRAFERALAELAGEPLLEEKLQVEKAVPEEEGWSYWQGDRRVFLPGAKFYAAGDTIPAQRGHRLRVYSYWTDGEFWKRPEWQVTRFSSLALWPLLPEVQLPNIPAMVHSSGAPLRSRFHLDQAGEDDLWAALDATGALTLLLGHTLDGQVSNISPVELLFSYLRERLLVVDARLAEDDPGRWHLIRSWAERERPAGCVLLFANGAS